jgi:hypothetical protein
MFKLRQGSAGLGFLDHCWCIRSYRSARADNMLCFWRRVLLCFADKLRWLLWVKSCSRLVAQLISHCLRVDRLSREAFILGAGQPNCLVGSPLPILLRPRTGIPRPGPCLIRK